MRIRVIGPLNASVSPLPPVPPDAPPLSSPPIPNVPMVRFLSLVLLAGALVLTGCDATSPTDFAADAPVDAPLAKSAPSSASDFVFLFKGNGVPADFAGAVADAGGRIIFQHDTGFAFVGGLSDAAATQLGARKDVTEMVADASVDLNLPGEIETAGGSVASPSNPADAFFYARQWNFPAVGADAAWAAGFLGSPDVTVAILDTGIDYTNPDLAGLVDLSRSVSFLPDEDALVQAFFPSKNLITDLQYHGTHVAATVASNGFAAAGLTSRTSLMGVKVCRVNRTCSFGAILSGVLYAADNGADVANLSLGGGFPKAGLGRFVGFINKTFNYANQKGMTVVVSAGNSASDLDANGNIYASYCDAPNAICVSATGPTGFGSVNGPFINVDAPAPYTNVGRSSISVAAPGGSALPVWAVCSQTSIVVPVCQTGTFIIGLSGTSMAAPHVSGLAALLVNELGRKPGQIKTAIQNSADDLGPSGTDKAYGKGRINVAAALGVE